MCFGFTIEKIDNRCLQNERIFEKTKKKTCFLSARQGRFCGGASPLLFLFAPNDNEKNVRDEKNLLTLGMFSIIIYLYE